MKSINNVLFLALILLFSSCRKETVEPDSTNIGKNTSSILKVERKNCDWYTESSTGCSMPAFHCGTPNSHVCKCGDWKCPTAIGSIEYWHEKFPYINTWADLYAAVANHDPGVIEFLNSL
ncbi:MAG TPA: hypothetical protein P5053_11215 [Bacteroidia bacterium]|jgi:hypothetical protein|nr:hypothetical protein [Bacteroidia bacterium]